MLDRLVLKNAVECTTQRLKWTFWSPSYDLFPPPLGQGVWGAKPPGKQGGLGRGARPPNDKRPPLPPHAANLVWGLCMAHTNSA